MEEKGVRRCRISNVGGIPMHFVVVGAGAVGGYFGGKLAGAGASVTFLVRERRFKQLAERGLRIHSVHGNFTCNPSLALRADAIVDPNVIILAVKNYHLQSTLPQLTDLVQKGAKVLPLLNGVKHIDRLIEAFGKDAMLGGSCYVEATLNSEGDILQTSPMQDVVFGPLGVMDRSLLTQIELWFERAKIPVRLSPHIMVDMWTKYLFLVTLSAITAATRLPVGPIRDDPVTYAFLRELVSEAFAIAKRCEPGLPDDVPDTMLTRLASVTPAMTSSMHRDLEKGLPLELDDLQGALIALAHEKGLDASHFEAIYALLHPFKEGKQDVKD